MSFCTFTKDFRAGLFCLIFVLGDFWRDLIINHYFIRTRPIVNTPQSEAPPPIISKKKRLFHKHGFRAGALVVLCDMALCTYNQDNCAIKMKTIEPYSWTQWSLFPRPLRVQILILTGGWPTESMGLWQEFCTPALGGCMNTNVCIF